MIGDLLIKLTSGEVRRDLADAVVGVAKDEIPFFAAVLQQKATGIASVSIDARKLVELEELAAHFDDLRVDLDDIDRGFRKITRDILRHAKGSSTDEQRAADFRRFAQQGELPVFLIREDEIAGVRVHAAFHGGIELKNAARDFARSLITDLDVMIKRLVLEDDTRLRLRGGHPAHREGKDAAQDHGSLLLERVFSEEEGRDGQEQQNRGGAEENAAHAEGGEQEEAGEEGADKAAK